MKKLIKENWYWVLMSIGAIYFLIAGDYYMFFIFIIISNISFLQDDISKLKKENDYLRSRIHEVKDNYFNIKSKLLNLEDNFYKHKK